MDDEVKDFLARLDGRWISDYQAESPRGCVLVAQGVLESRLGDVIAGHVLATRTAARNFVRELQGGRSNPVGSFAASIDYAEKHKVVERWMAKALRRINKLRVSFAHYTFPPPQSPEIQMDEAKSVFDLLPTEEQRFVEGLFGKSVEGPGEHPTARQVFLGCAFRLTIILEVMIYNSRSSKS